MPQHIIYIVIDVAEARHPSLSHVFAGLLRPCRPLVVAPPNFRHSFTAHGGIYRAPWPQRIGPKSMTHFNVVYIHTLTALTIFAYTCYDYPSRWRDSACLFAWLSWDANTHGPCTGMLRVDGMTKGLPTAQCNEPPRSNLPPPPGLFHSDIPRPPGQYHSDIPRPPGQYHSGIPRPPGQYHAGPQIEEGWRAHSLRLTPPAAPHNLCNTSTVLVVPYSHPVLFKSIQAAARSRWSCCGPRSHRHSPSEPTSFRR